MPPQIREQHNTPPFWPGLQAVGPRQRVERHEEYQVLFEADDHSDRWSIHPRREAEFLRYSRGQGYRVEWTQAGGFTILQQIR